MNNPTLQDIKDRLNIADVISGYIQLKKAGANFKALCPFHNEKTPSLQISPQKQIWHCFGCGEGGDVFTFVKKIENLDFRDTVKLLAEKAGVQLPEYRPADKQAEEEKDRLLRINNFASRYWNEILLKDKRAAVAREYLQNRGLAEATVKQWRIGFAPDDFHGLEQALAKKNVSAEDMVKAGVSSKNERAQVYDRFRGRVTFPIYNYVGDVVGFSARILPVSPSASRGGHDDGKSAKYINSPETPIYSKSKVLFGLNFAKEAIRKKDEAVIVEGQMDCISSHQAGFLNTVASSGTALTEQQLVQLSRLTKNLKFCFDADTAGQSASRRAGELALKKGFSLKIIVLKTAKDPDELIKKSPGLWEKAVFDAERFVDFYIRLAEEQMGGDAVEQKRYLSGQVVPLIGYIQDPLEQDHYVRQIAEKFNITEQVIRGLIKNLGKPAVDPHLPAVETPNSENNQNNQIEKHILGGMLVLPEFLSYVLQQGQAKDFTSAAVEDIVMSLFLGQKVTPQVLENPLAKEAEFMLELELENGPDGKDAALRDLQKDFAQLRLAAIKRSLTDLTRQIMSAESKKETAKVEELNREFAVLTNQRLAFEKKL